MIPHVIVVDDKSSMWGSAVRVFGPYPDRHAALMDKDRVSALYPRRAFIEVSELKPGEFTVRETAPPKKYKNSSPIPPKEYKHSSSIGCNSSDGCEHEVQP